MPGELDRASLGGNCRWATWKLGLLTADGRAYPEAPEGVGPVTRDHHTRQPRSALAAGRNPASHLPPRAGHRLNNGPTVAFDPAMADSPTQD